MPGFVVACRLRELPQLPYTTTVTGGLINIGASATRALGLVWLLTGLSCLVVAAGIFGRAAWSGQVAWVTLGVSAVLCVLGWPAARLGLIANVLIGAFLLTGTKMGWLLPAPESGGACTSIVS